MVDRKSKPYKSMCYRVRKRDYHKCQYPKCDRLCKKTEVHHILPVATHEHLALEEKNCILLCKTHHDLVTGKEFAFASMFSAIVNSKYVKAKYMVEFLGLKYGSEI